MTELTCRSTELVGPPVVGHLLAFRRDRLGLLNACAATPGDVIELRLRSPAYLLKRAEDIRHVLVTRQALYPKTSRQIGPRATRIFGNGLITSSDEPHRRMRRRVQPVFRRASVAGQDEVVARGVDAAIERWRKAGDVDLADEMTRLALDTLISSLLGPTSPSDFRALENGLIARRRSMSLSSAWPTTLPAFLPIALWPPQRRAITRADKTLDRLIREHGDLSGSPDDLLSMVMDTHEGGRSESCRRQVHGEALTLVLAAYENVARALTWTFLALARHPHVEAKLTEEVQRVLGDRPPTADDCTELRYAGMVVAESMRLWPPSALVFRVAREDDVLPTGARIRAGSKLLLSPYVVQREPAYYPDPERFDPERFSEEARRGRPKHAYFPFGGGPRVCIGQALATLQCTLVLARTAQKVRLELSGEPRGYVCGCLPPAFGPRMRVSCPA